MNAWIFFDQNLRKYSSNIRLDLTKFILHLGALFVFHSVISKVLMKTFRPNVVFGPKKNFVVVIIMTKIYQELLKTYHTNVISSWDVNWCCKLFMWWLQNFWCWVTLHNADIQQIITEQSSSFGFWLNQNNVSMLCLEWFLINFRINFSFVSLKN